MSYELLVLPVPPGAEIEEAGEALEVRLTGGHVFRDCSDSAAIRRRALAAVASAADAALVPAEEPRDGRIVLAAGDGVSVEIDAAFAVLRVPYSVGTANAEAAFERLFRVVGAIVRDTGWAVYDPQEASPVNSGDSGRDAALEIYLSVVDQLRV